MRSLTELFPRPGSRRLAAWVAAPAVVGAPIAIYLASIDTMDAGRPLAVVATETFLRGAPVFYRLPGLASLIVTLAAKARPSLKIAISAVAMLSGVSAVVVTLITLFVSESQDFGASLMIGAAAGLLTGLIGLVYCLIAGVPWRADGLNALPTEQHFRLSPRRWVRRWRRSAL